MGFMRSNMLLRVGGTATAPVLLAGAILLFLLHSKLFKRGNRHKLYSTLMYRGSNHHNHNGG